MQRRAIKTQTGEGNGNICGGGLLKPGHGGGKWEYTQRRAIKTQTGREMGI